MQGIVFDKETKGRLIHVNMYNTRLQQAVYNNSKGEFSINTKTGDKLIFSLEGYKSDTLIVRNQTSLIIFLEKKAIQLPQVTVKDSTLSAKEKYEELKKQFNTLHRIGNNKDLVSIGPGGVGLSIDALWSAFSREGKNARKLMAIMERDYQNDFIDARFNPAIVSQVTGLINDRLYIFLQKYKPSFYFAAKASDYEMLEYIKMSYNRFKNNPYYKQDISTFTPINTDAN